MIHLMDSINAFIMFQKVYISNKYYINIWSSTTVFNIDKKKYFLSCKSEWFLKGHMTLKNSALPSQAKNYIFKYIKIENSYF